MGAGEGRAVGTEGAGETGLELAERGSVRRAGAGARAGPSKKTSRRWRCSKSKNSSSKSKSRNRRSSKFF